jgi:dephospho-CoA kinase
MKLNNLIAIVGGIGSGKSVVSHILTCMGYLVYDCDSRAKSLMNSSENIKHRISTEIDNSVIVNGEIDRQRLASIVFADAEKLFILNNIVHHAVAEDLTKWVAKHGCEDKPIFVETAILYTSGLDKLVNSVWRVTAPIELRIARVMKRNAITREQVIERINSQTQEESDSEDMMVRTILNDETTPILPQINDLLSL